LQRRQASLGCQQTSRTNRVEKSGSDGPPAPALHLVTSRSGEVGVAHEGDGRFGAAFAADGGEGTPRGVILDPSGYSSLGS
jgi:hypothetical protein